MDIPDCIRHIPAQFDHAVIQLIDGGVAVKRTMHRLWETSRDQMCATNLWQQTGKPIYEHYIKPLQMLDYLLVGSSVILTIVALKVCTVAAFPLCLSLGALAISCACVFSLYRIHKHFSRIAWEYIDQIRRTAHAMTCTHPLFGDIYHQRAKLQQPEFNHLEDDLKKLDKEIDQFRTAVLAPNYEDKKKIIQAHLVYMKGLLQTHAHDTALIETLEQEVEKVGKQDQDLATLEKSKQALHDLETDEAKSKLDELKQQMNALYQAMEGPILSDSKKAFLEYLTGLQQKLASERTIEALDELDEEHEDNPTIAIEEEANENNDQVIAIDEIEN